MRTDTRLFVCLFLVFGFFLIVLNGHYKDVGLMTNEDYFGTAPADIINPSDRRRRVCVCVRRVAGMEKNFVLATVEY